MNDFGKAVKTLRTKSKLSQQQLAEKIGIKKEQLSEVETGKVLPTKQMIKDIANGLNIPVTSLKVFFQEIKSKDKTLIAFQKSLKKLIVATISARESCVKIS